MVYFSNYQELTGSAAPLYIPPYHISPRQVDMSLKGDITHDGKITVGFIVLISLLTGAMSYFTCIVGDDLFYSGVYSDTIFGGKPFPGFEPWFELFKNHWMYTNGRFGDKFMPLFLVLPHLSLAFIQTICTFIICKYASLLTIGAYWATSRRSILLTSALLILPPWYNTGFLVCILVNYQIALALSLPWTWYYINPPKDNKWTLFALGLLSVLVGMWHEGFSVFALPAVILSQILRKDKTRSTWLMTVGFIVGVIILLSSPGFWARMDTSFAPREYIWPLFIKKSFIELAFIALVLFTVIRNYRCNLRPILSRAQWIFVSVALTIVFCTIYVNFHVTADNLSVWWFAAVYSIIGCFILLGPVRDNVLLKNVVTGIAGVAVLVHLCLCVYYQYQVKEDYDRIMAQYLSSNTGVVYADAVNKAGPQLLTLRKSQYYLYDYLLPHAHSVHSSDKPMILLPTEFKTLKPSAIIPIKGSPGFYLTPGGEYIFQNFGRHEPGEAWFCYLDKSGTNCCFKVYAMPIKIDADSDYVYMRLSRSIDREEVAVPLGLYY